jgi:hypothetical protein
MLTALCAMLLEWAVELRRPASILDPFGQRWTVMTRLADVSPAERDRRMAEWAKENVGS